MGINLVATVVVVALVFVVAFMWRQKVIDKCVRNRRASSQQQQGSAELPEMGTTYASRELPVETRHQGLNDEEIRFELEAPASWGTCANRI